MISSHERPINLVDRLRVLPYPLNELKPRDSDSFNESPFLSYVPRNQKGFDLDARKLL